MNAQSPTINHEAAVFVSFYSEAVEDAAATAREGRPIFKDAEFVRVQQAGDRKRVHVAPAHEPFQLDRATGYHLTYAERYAEQYQAFKRHGDVLANGTPIDLAPFLTPALKAEFKSAVILTVEALAGLQDREIAKFGGNMRVYVKEAKAWLERTHEEGVAAKALAENARLQAQIDDLKALIQAGAVAQATGGGDMFDAMTDDGLRDHLASMGIAVRANAARDKLLAAAREAAE